MRHETTLLKRHTWKSRKTGGGVVSIELYQSGYSYRVTTQYNAERFVSYGAACERYQNLRQLLTDKYGAPLTDYERAHVGKGN